MKVKPSVKPICEKCKVIRRKGRVMVICQNPSTSSARAENRRSGVKCVESRRRPRHLTWDDFWRKTIMGTYCRR